MDKPRKVIPDIEILPSHYPIPGVGLIPINAFVVKVSEPVFIDIGMGIESEGFMEALESVVNPRQLKWVWLTHDDADYTGSLKRVLEAAPDARLAAPPGSTPFVAPNQEEQEQILAQMRG